MTPRGGLVRKSPGHAFPVGRGVVVAPVLWARVLALTKAANRPARRCQRAGIVRQGDRRPADYRKVATQQGTSPRLIEDRTNGHSGCSGPVATRRVGRIALRNPRPTLTDTHARYAATGGPCPRPGLSYARHRRRLSTLPARPNRRPRRLHGSSHLGARPPSTVPVRLKSTVLMFPRP